VLERLGSIPEIPDAEVKQVVAWLGLEDDESIIAYLDMLQTPEKLLQLQEKVSQHPLVMKNLSLKFKLAKLCFAAAQNSHIKAVLKPTQKEEDFSFVPTGFHREGSSV
jgi:hypothetical protein